MPLINGRQVGPIGLGLMGFTWAKSPPPETQAFEALRAALDTGCNFWNGGEFYGPLSYNSAVLLNRYLEHYPGDAGRFVLSIKAGINIAAFRPDSSPASVRASMDNTLRQLGPRLQHIDVFECARRDPSVPLADTFAALADGYIKARPPTLGAIGISEVSAQSIHDAVATGHPIAGVEIELSLWSTECLTNGVAAACAQHNIPLIAYSPMGRGILTGAIKSVDDLPKDDMRRHYPRFQPENFAINLQLVDAVAAIAKKKGCTPAQLAINWVRCLSNRPGMPTIIPIPGASTAARVRENAVLVDLTDAEMDEIDAILAKFEVRGGRYPDGAPVDT